MNVQDRKVTRDLVSSSNVNGEYVYDTDGNHVGTIDHLMIDKVSGNVAYAVMRFGGFLGLGEEEYSLPWKSISYSPEQGGFVTGITEEQLRNVPAYERSDDHWYNDREYEERMHRHYGATYPYWM